MENKKEVTSTEEVTNRKVIHKEILHILEKNEISYREAKEILIGMAHSMERLATKQKVKVPF